MFVRPPVIPVTRLRFLPIGPHCFWKALLKTGHSSIPAKALPRLPTAGGLIRQLYGARLQMQLRHNHSHPAQTNKQLPLTTLSPSRLLSVWLWMELSVSVSTALVQSEQQNSFHDCVETIFWPWPCNEIHRNSVWHRVHTLALKAMLT